MLRKQLAALALLTVLAAPVAACGNDDDGADAPQAPNGQEDPTLGEESDMDNGNPANQTDDNGSGTGSGRGDG
ncbi:MAG TPA: hypothetical protein VF230_01570 [Acidimicrobiales bacterium]